MFYKITQRLLYIQYTVLCISYSWIFVYLDIQCIWHNIQCILYFTYCILQSTLYKPWCIMSIALLGSIRWQSLENIQKYTIQCMNCEQSSLYSAFMYYIPVLYYISQYSFSPPSQLLCYTHVYTVQCTLYSVQCTVYSLYPL